jgi:hypothetical protein
MVYDEKTLKMIYSRTDGYCHICGKKLSLKNYARLEGKERGLSSQINGGSDHLNNLYSACIICNREKEQLLRKPRDRGTG